MSKKKSTSAKEITVSETKRLQGAAAPVSKPDTNAIGFFTAALNAANKRLLSFFKCKYSAVPTTALFVLLMAITYALFGHHILTKTFAIAFPFSFPFYLIDYRAGFISRALIGQIISFFTDSVSVYQILMIARGVIIVSLVLQAGVAACAFKKAYINKSPLICLLCVCFVISPVTVASYSIYLGYLDPFNLILTILYFYISDKKISYFLTPVICFTGILLHYQFVFAFLPAILSVHLYYVLKDKNRRGLKAVSFFVCVAVSAASAVYLILFSKSHIKLSAAELYANMCEKFSDYHTWGLFEEYFTFYIYGDFNGQNYSNPVEFIGFLLNYAFDRLNTKSLCGYAATLVPVYAVIEYLYIYMFRRSEKEKRFTLFVFMLQPFVAAVTMVISTDQSRWAAASFFSNFALLFTLVKNKEPLLYEAAEKLKKPLVLTVIVAVFAAGYIITLLSMKKIML